jgi:hypothetical protein
MSFTSVNCFNWLGYDVISEFIVEIQPIMLLLSDFFTRKFNAFITVKCKLKA